MENKKILAMDFDDVLCGTTKAFLDFNAEKYGVSFLYSEANADLDENLGISEEEGEKRWDDFFNDETFCYPAPEESLIETLMKLKENYKLIILTARYKRWKSQILKWIEKYAQGIFEEIIFISELPTEMHKGEFCKKNEIHALVDDSPDQIESCIENKIEIIIYNQPWNKSFKDIQRIQNIQEIINILE